MDENAERSKVSPSGLQHVLVLANVSHTMSFAAESVCLLRFKEVFVFCLGPSSGSSTARSFCKARASLKQEKASLFAQN